MDRKEQIVDNEFYHIYNRGNNRQKIFLDDDDYQFFMRRLHEYARRHHVQVVIYCLMPNRYHLILSQDNGGSIASMMNALATSVAKHFNLRHRRSGHLFQGPYRYKRLGSGEHLIHVARYIHVNAVIAGLVDEPEDWKYSNYGSLIERGEGYLQPGEKKATFSTRNDSDKGNLLLSFFDNDPRQYKEFVNSYTREKLEELRRFLFDDEEA